MSEEFEIESFEDLIDVFENTDDFGKYYLGNYSNIQIANYLRKMQQENKHLKELKYKFFDNSGDEESFTLEDYLEISNKLYDYEQENKQLKDTLREILHFCNHLHNDCKYRLNDGHIRKIRNICKKVLNEEKEMKENEN